MKGFTRCVRFLIVNGIGGFLLGRLLPKTWFRGDAFPYRRLPFEQDGKIYARLKVRHWQKRVPDMSRIFPWIMPKKAITGDVARQLPRMIQETCVAECIHALVSLTGLYCIRLWPGIGGITMAVIHFLLFNLPYIIIQRYNRPRLMGLAARLEGKEGIKAEGRADWKQEGPLPA